MQQQSSALRALAPDLPEACAALAFVRWHYDFDWHDTERHLRALIEFSPRDPLGHHFYSMFLAETGRFEEAKTEINRALELDPNAAILHASAGLVFYLARRYKLALAACRAALRLDHRCFRAGWVLGLTHEQQGNAKHAVRQFRRLASLSGDNPVALIALAHAYALSDGEVQARAILERLRGAQNYVPAAELAVVYCRLGELDRAFELLERGVVERSAYLALLKVEPRLDPLRSDSRFARILARIGLAEGWDMVACTMV